MAKVYVGTYKKYNEGSLKGAWLDLSKYETYDDFLKACKDLHKDEPDPEFMIQDTEDFPDGLDCMEWLSRKEFDDVKEAMKEEQSSDDTPAVNIVDYSEKAFAVIGDTRPLKDLFKKLGGKFNPRLSCGAGWIFSNRLRGEIQKRIACGNTTATNEKKNKSLEDLFTGWLKEYLANGGDDYDKKNSIGAINLHGGYYLIDKPSIENRFCFHDEGPDYEYYQSLCADEKKMIRHFKNQNLREFDNKIDRMVKGSDFNNDKRVWLRVIGKRTYLSFYNKDGEKDFILCNEDERMLILQGLRFGRKMFEKRLDSYIKRYGTSKIHTWTYWADA